MSKNLLDSLFKWHKELTIKDRSGNSVEINGKPVVVYQRVVGDFEISEARKQALSASRLLRQKLRDPDTPEHNALFPDFNEMDNETIINGIILAEAFSIRNEAEKTYKKPRKPVQPGSDADLEEQENYEVALEKYDDKVEKAIVERTKELIEQKKEELSSKSRQELIDIFTGALINSLCQTEMVRTFNEWCTYLGTYKNKTMTQRAFPSFAAFANSATQLKGQLIDSYLALEIGGKELKN